MPSFVVDKNNVVVAVMSFDPVSPEQQKIERYDSTIIGKQLIHGEFVEVEPLQNGSDATTNDGGALDE
ncbi:hypothetical protein NB496_09215 [Vibrio alginolyticus]|uniref:hypothetical protein n=1 Tax=Vibrio alginolyticus TaxID=663 RepID=UPI00215CA0F6|nr:hypothetical protein [Vibrio alginolyticus]MCR9640809.1 hypothetical protein [Vibrio alginolyticus]